MTKLLYIWTLIVLILVPYEMLKVSFAEPISKPRQSTTIPLSIMKELQVDLQEALELYQMQSAEKWTFATDPNERNEANFGYSFVLNLIKKSEYDLLFQLADEAFEREIGVQGGAGGKHSMTRGFYSPIHQGELGGLDGTSCRSCHFSGGPDGAGSGSQLTMLRGDGQTLASAVLRDPPHVMGLGYIQLLAQNMQKEIDYTVREAKINAKRIQDIVSTRLITHDINFGTLHVHPDQTLDTKDIQGISKDLIIRPFGWKGRHANLATLCDEALQVHHGLQTKSRLNAYTTESHQHIYLGDGPKNDKDQDGVSYELGDGQALGLASYLSLIGTPRILVPNDQSLLLPWARGKEQFVQIGCAQCHKMMTRTTWAPVHLQAQGNQEFVEVNLKAGGLEPRPRQLDFAPSKDGQIHVGLPLFLFSDLKRHDMGEALSDSVDEVLNEDEKVNRSMWLTRPLWGLADTAPYLHDGRAQNVDEAIMWHGGEAKKSRHLYKILSEEEKGELRLFLMSLSRKGTLMVE